MYPHKKLRSNSSPKCLKDNLRLICYVLYQTFLFMQWSHEDLLFNILYECLRLSAFIMNFHHIIAGIFKHSVSISKALLAEVTPKDQRSKAFGYFNGISSSGFIIGPLVGGHLAETENGFYKVAMLTSVIFAFCFRESSLIILCAFSKKCVNTSSSSNVSSYVAHNTSKWHLYALNAIQWNLVITRTSGL